MNRYAVKLAIQHLLAHPGQTALLMAGVALGVSVFIFMSALIGGLATLLTQRTVGSIPHVVLEMPDRDPSVLVPSGAAQVVLQKDLSRLDQIAIWQPAVPIIEKDGKPGVSPSMNTVLDGSYQPLARPIFVYVNAKSMAKPEVKEFVDFDMKEGAKIAKEVKYVPLPSKAYAINLEHIAQGKKGTVFGGVPEVGITIEELQKREDAK